MQVTNLRYKFNLHDPTLSQTLTNYASLKATFNGKQFGMFVETHRTELSDEEYDAFKEIFIQQATKELTYDES